MNRSVVYNGGPTDAGQVEGTLLKYPRRLVCTYPSIAVGVPVPILQLVLGLDMEMLKDSAAPVALVGLPHVVWEAPDHTVSERVEAHVVGSNVVISD